MKSLFKFFGFSQSQPQNIENIWLNYQRNYDLFTADIINKNQTNPEIIFTQIKEICIFLHNALS